MRNIEICRRRDPGYAHVWRYWRVSLIDFAPGFSVEYSIREDEQSKILTALPGLVRAGDLAERSVSGESGFGPKPMPGSLPRRTREVADNRLFHGAILLLCQRVRNRRLPLSHPQLCTPQTFGKMDSVPSGRGAERTILVLKLVGDGVYRQYRRARSRPRFRCAAIEADLQKAAISGDQITSRITRRTGSRRRRVVGPNGRGRAPPPLPWQNELNTWTRRRH